MIEQTPGQAAPTNSGVASGDATVKPPVQGTSLTAAAIQQAFRDNPELLKEVKLPTKVDKQEVEVPLADVRDNYQLRSASQQRFELASAKEKDLERREAELAARGDPVKLLLDRLQPPAAAQPVDPLNGLNLEGDYTGSQAMLADVLRKQLREAEALKAENQQLKSKLPEVEKLAQSAVEAQRSYETRVRIERDFEEARQRNSDFTARIVADASGKYSVDFGSNPYVTQEAIRLANSDVPDARLGGRAGSSMSLPEIADAVSAHNEKLIEDRRAAKAAAKQEALRNLPGMAVAGAQMPEPSPKTTILPTDTPDVRREKQRLIREEITAEMAAQGYRG